MQSQAFPVNTGWSVLAVCCLCAGLVQADPPPRQYHLDAAERASIDEASKRGADWLVAHQDANGAFLPVARRDVCPVALTAMALSALCGVDAAPDEAAPGLQAVQFLLQYQQADGGIYRPEQGLPVYTSGVAAQALRAFHDRHETHLVAKALPPVELYVYRQGVPESLVDAGQGTGTASDRSAETAHELLQAQENISSDQRRALEFIARCGSAIPARRPVRTRIPGWSPPGASLGPFTYEDLLPFIYRPVKPEHQIAMRALEAVKSYYALEQNPDLTKRYGQAGFQPGSQGLYYYYLLLAKCLSVYEVPVVRLNDGQSRDWVRELKGTLLSLQHDEGYWVNEDGHWWEDEPTLVTSYALLALRLCRDMERGRTRSD